MQTKLVFGLSAVASLTLLGACSANTNTVSTAGTQSTGDTELRMTIWSSNPDHIALLEGIASDCSSDVPGVHVKFDSLGDSYTEVLATQIAGGAGPDLAWMKTTDTKDFIDAGALVPLSQRFKDTEGYDFADISETASAVFTQDGELYGYPFSNGPFAVFANLSLLESAGVPTPQAQIDEGNWTWDTLIANGATISGDTGKAGIVIQDFNYQDWTQLTGFWEAWNASPWSEDGRTATFASPEMVEAMTAYTTGMAQGAFPEPGATFDFFAGDAGYVVTLISRAALLDDSFDWDLVPLPSGPGGEYTTLGQAGISVLQSSKHPEEATAMLACMTNPEHSKQLAQYFVPPRVSQLTVDVLSSSNPKLSDDQLENAVISRMPLARPGLTNLNMADINQNVRASMDALWVPGADPKTVLTNVDSSLQPVLDQN